MWYTTVMFMPTCMVDQNCCRTLAHLYPLNLLTLYCQMFGKKLAYTMSLSSEMIKLVSNNTRIPTLSWGSYI